MRRTAYTLVEMLTTVAVLVILLGLVVSLARHVRERSAQALTKNLLRQLDSMMTQYANRFDGAVPQVSAFPPAEAILAAALSNTIPGAGPTTRAMIPLEAPRVDRQLLLRSANLNNRDFLAAFRANAGMTDRLLSEFPVSVYDDSGLRDAWGSPIVFMPAKHPWVGTAPRDKVYFFFSAGPDRDYLTRDDNLYSYEEIAGGR